MIYLLLNTNQIKILSLKRSLLGHYDIVFYEKKYQMHFIKNGQIVNPDLTASAIKEALNLINNSKLNDRDVTLILPQESFEFLRTDVPPDMTSSVLSTYIKEKARAQLTVDLENCYYDHLVIDSEDQKKMIFYAMDSELYQKYTEPFNLLDLRVKAITPETLAFYKLFDKTLRREKKENILYASYDGKTVQGYVYDSFGLLESEHWKKDLKEKETVEEVLKAKAQELEKKKIKLNRLILSGEESENIRQDTFTKNVGVWTNPLKRIMPHFYADYLKMFASQDNKPIPYLQFDACIGAFILATENKDFSLLKRKVNDFNYKTYKPSSRPSFNFVIPWRPIFFFLGAFVISLGVLYGLSKLHLGNAQVKMPVIAMKNPFTKPTETPTPTIEPTMTPTPTPKLERSEIKVKVLNGGGVPGKATVVKNLLKEKGYEEILTGNADDFDYETTEIQVKKDGTNFGELMKADIKDNSASPKISTLDEDEAPDVVVIIGKDFK
jgi:predicted transposase YbfD/YdcC